jgi:hypothetical protein
MWYANRRRHVGENRIDGRLLSIQMNAAKRSGRMCIALRMRIVCRDREDTALSGFEKILAAGLQPPNVSFISALLR